MAHKKERVNLDSVDRALVVYTLKNVFKVLGECKKKNNEIYNLLRRYMDIFEKHMIHMYGDLGKEWLANLPIRIEQLAKEWNLSDLQPVPNLSYNYVLLGLQNALPIVLKLTLSNKELAREIAALKVFDGYGIMPLLAYTEDAILIEQAHPGNTLREYFPSQENSSLYIFSQIIDVMHRASADPDRLKPYINNFTPLHEVVSVLEREWKIPEKYLIKARLLKDHLLETTQDHVVLHGDLHHGNILQQGGSFMAIDPKGYIGDRWYDVGPFIRNPIDVLVDLPDALSLLSTRIEMLALTMKGDAERITQWGYVQSVLTWIWAIEDGSTYIDSLKKQVCLFDQLTQ